MKHKDTARNDGQSSTPRAADRTTWIVVGLAIGYLPVATLLLTVPFVPLVTIVGLNLVVGLVMHVLYRRVTAADDRSQWFVTGFYLVPPVAGIEYGWRQLGYWHPTPLADVSDDDIATGSRNGVITIAAAYMVVLAAGLVLGDPGDHLVTVGGLNVIFGTWIVYFLRHHAQAIGRPLHPIWYPLVYLCPPVGGSIYLLVRRVATDDTSV